MLYFSCMQNASTCPDCVIIFGDCHKHGQCLYPLVDINCRAVTPSLIQAGMWVVLQRVGVFESPGWSAAGAWRWPLTPIKWRVQEWIGAIPPVPHLRAPPWRVAGKHYFIFHQKDGAIILGKWDSVCFKAGNLGECLNLRFVKWQGTGENRKITSFLMYFTSHFMTKSRRVRWSEACSTHGREGGRLYRYTALFGSPEGNVALRTQMYVGE
jgi:hypothetical protein